MTFRMAPVVLLLLALAGCSRAGSPAYGDVPFAAPITHIEKGACLVGADLPSPSSDGDLVGVKGKPRAVVAVWWPGMNDHPCTARRTQHGAAVARRLAHDIQQAHAFGSGVVNCPMDDGRAVVLWFRFPAESAQQVVVSLGGCTPVYGEGHRPRVATPALIGDLAAIAPHAWSEWARNWLS